MLRGFGVLGPFFTANEKFVIFFNLRGFGGILKNGILRVYRNIAYW